MAGPEPVPAPRDVAAALRTTTETLARELASPSSGPPAWSDFEWRIAEAASAMHGVSALLAHRLRWQGPSRWQRFLDEQSHQTRVRHERIVALVKQFDTLAGREGVAMTALKGVALHALGLYRAGERPMADVDLLVRDLDRAGAVRVLEQAGYALCCGVWKHDVWMPREATEIVGFAEHVANPVKVDLHVRIRERLPLVEVDITPVLLGSSQAGLHGYPSIGALMVHLLLHAAGNMPFRSLRLIQLHDIARLAARLDAADWDVVAGLSSPWWALPPLELAVRYCGLVVSPAVLARFERACPRHLRRTIRHRSLTDVSLSNPWIEAFPGIEWSPTARDGLRYAVQRIRPRHETLVARADAVRAAPWIAETPWARMPQWRRIVHWVRARPPRYETMHSVAAALRETPVDPRTASAR
jgi:hypothetical protein